MNVTLEAYAERVSGVSIDKLSLDQRLYLNQQYLQYIEQANKQGSIEFRSFYEAALTFKLNSNYSLFNNNINSQAGQQKLQDGFSVFIERGDD